MNNRFTAGTLALLMAIAAVLPAGAENAEVNEECPDRFSSYACLLASDPKWEEIERQRKKAEKDFYRDKCFEHGENEGVSTAFARMANECLVTKDGRLVAAIDANDPDLRTKIWMTDRGIRFYH